MDNSNEQPLVRPGAVLKADASDPEARKRAASLLGQVTSDAKAAAAAANARLGGRPKGQQDSEESRQRKRDAWVLRRERKAATENAPHLSAAAEQGATSQ